MKIQKNIQILKLKYMDFFFYLIKVKLNKSYSKIYR